MWIVRWVSILAVIILAILFIWLNSEQLANIVTVNFWKFQTETPLFLALFVAFIFGALVWFPVAIIQYLQIKAELRSLRKENNRLQKELGDLRNISIDESETPGTSGEDEE